MWPDPCSTCKKEDTEGWPSRQVKALLDIGVLETMAVLEGQISLCLVPVPSSLTCLYLLLTSDPVGQVSLFPTRRGKIVGKGG